MNISSSTYATLLFLTLCGCNQAASDSPAGNSGTTTAGESAADTGPLNLIDLSTFERLPGAINPLMKSATMVMYTAPGKPVEAYETIKKQLLAERWRELPGANLSTEYGYANGNFSHQGYLLGV